MMKKINGYDSIVDMLNSHDSSLAEIAQDAKLKSDGSDNTTILSSFITSLGSTKTTIIIANGTYDIKTNLTIPSNVDLLFRRGGLLRINTGATLNVKGNIIAGNQEIFIDSGGKVVLDQSPNEYNLGWFQTTNGYINERWNFASRGMLTFLRKIVRVPKPYDGQAGTVNTNGRIYWLFSDEILITDNMNCAKWYIDGEFKANNNCTNFLRIDDAAKPENIYFYGDISVNIDPTIVVNYGLNIKSTARLDFYGNVVINGAQTSIKLGGADQSAPVGDVHFIELQCSFFYQTALSIYGLGTYSGVQNLTIENLAMSSAQTTGLNAVEIRGLLRDIHIQNVNYSTDVAKDGYAANDVANVVYMESNNEGSMLHVRIDAIYQANATNALKTNSVTSPLSANNMEDIYIGHIFGKFNASAVVLDYCNRLTIDEVENISTVTINNTCYYVMIRSNGGLKNITDNGNYTIINGFGKQSRGAGVIPSASVNWPIGAIVRETADGRMYRRIQNTGVDASDFVQVSGGGKGIATIAASTTSITVTHGLGYTPTNIVATAKGNVGNVWPSGINSTQFTINCATAPGSNTDISWRAD